MTKILKNIYNDNIFSHNTCYMGVDLFTKSILIIILT